MFDASYSRKAIYDWVQKADLQLASDASPDQITVDKTVIRINSPRYWLYAAISSYSNRFYIYGCFRRKQRY